MSTLNELVDEVGKSHAEQEQRIAKLEGARSRKDFWDILGVVASAVTPILVFVFGLGLKDSVDQALKREELHLTSVKDMQDALTLLEKPDVTKEAGLGASLTLAAFGHFAVPSLVMVLDEGDEIRAPAAEQALRGIAFSEPHSVCEPVFRVLQNRAGRFVWLTQLASLRLIADAQCSGSSTVLGEYERQLAMIKDEETLKHFASTVSQRIPPSLESVRQLREQIAQTTAIIVTAPKQ